MFAAEARKELPVGTARRWADHTKDIKSLPEKVKKQAFVANFLLRCAARNITDPAAVAVAAEKYASELEKAADYGMSTLGDLAGRVAGVGALGAAAGIGLPLLGGYAAGQLGGAAHNQVDTDDAESLRIAALANAYRRQAVAAKMQSQVRDLVDKNPGKYVVVG